MATLDELMTRLREFPDRVAEKSKELMISETPIGPTGNLQKSISVLEKTNEYCVVGTQLYYAEFVEKGRGPVPSVQTRNDAKKKGEKPKMLHYWGYNPGNDKSIHGKKYGGGDEGVEYFMRSVKRAKANPFAKRARTKINNANWHAVLMRH